MHSGSQFQVDPPPDLKSRVWADDYNETKTVGSLTSTTRTAEQTEIGYFWADSGPLLWQNALRYISGTYLHDTGASARMFALAEAALADAQIACWDSKYFYNFWRPITAIRLGGQDGNPATVVDPNWQPLINTPNFPEYPSGHADVSGAVSHMLRLFFGTDELTFQMTTTNPLASRRRAPSPASRRRSGRSSTRACTSESTTATQTLPPERRAAASRIGSLSTICVRLMSPGTTRRNSLNRLSAGCRRGRSRPRRWCMSRISAANRPRRRAWPLPRAAL
jgi:hypothetical protein